MRAQKEPRRRVGAVKLGEATSWATWRGATVIHLDHHRFGVLCGTNKPGLRVGRLVAPLRSEYVCKTCLSRALALPAPETARLAE